MAEGVDWDPSMIAEEIAKIRREYQIQARNEIPSPKIQFDFACALIASCRYSDVKEAIFLLDELLDVGFRRNDTLHYMTLAHLKLGNYGRCKEKLDTWIHLEPGNGLAKVLHSVIIERASHDGWIGALGFGTIAAGVGLYLAWQRLKK
mmetsp:Transcript_21069/g.39599  ORF Transcript_21069/g.39599 Transcript_21069/m.39599 type:complete len:148 (+) Transcript_21069:56-499(+)